MKQGLLGKSYDVYILFSTKTINVDNEKERGFQNNYVNISEICLSNVTALNGVITDIYNAADE